MSGAEIEMNTETPRGTRSRKHYSAATKRHTVTEQSARTDALKHPARLKTSHAAAKGADIRDSPFAESMRGEADADLRHRLISEAAYELFTQRGYQDGFDLEDWLVAEARVDGSLKNGLPQSEEPDELRE
jgi:hypothetical protein